MTRPFILAIALLMASLGGQEAIADSPLALARQLEWLLAHRRPPKEEGLGVLVIDVRLTDKSWFNRSQSDQYEVELTPALGGDPHQFPMRLGAAGVATLPADRYCLTAIIRNGRRHESKCELSYFDVTAHSVDFTGRLDVRAAGGHARVMDRELTESCGDLNLSNEQRSSIAHYLDAAAAHGTRTFFVSSPANLPIIIRLFADGTAEMEEYAPSNSSYASGQWSGDAELVASFYEGNTVYRFSRDGDAWAASTAWMAHHEGIEFPVDNQVAASDRVECWHWARCGSRIRSGVVWNAEYNWIERVRDLNGSIELEFGLQGDKAIAKPRRTKVVSSDLPRDQIKAITRRFADTRFSADLIPQASNQRFRMSIDFRVNGERLSANLGPIAVVKAP